MLSALRTNKEIKAYRGIGIRVHTCHPNTILRRDALRFGDLSATPKTLWIQCRYKKQEFTYLVPRFSDREGFGLER